MLRPKHICTLMLALVATLVVVAPAGATNYHDAIRDCFDDGVLEGHYSRHELQQALGHLPSDQAEYSDCQDVLRRALTASGSSHGGGGGAAGGAAAGIGANPSLSTPSGAQAGSQQDLNALRAQTGDPGKSAPPKVDVSGSPITPAAAHFDANSLPGSLLAALIGLAAASAVAAFYVIGRRWPQVRRVALRIVRR